MTGLFKGTGDGTVTQRVAPLPGMDPGVLGKAGEDKPGPSVKVKVPTVVTYLVLDVLIFNYVTGWVAAAAFYGAGSFEMHKEAPVGELAVLAFVSWKAVVPGAVFAMKDVAMWLNQVRQAHGVFR